MKSNLTILLYQWALLHKVFFQLNFENINMSVFYFLITFFKEMCNSTQNIGLIVQPDSHQQFQFSNISDRYQKLIIFTSFNSDKSTNFLVIRYSYYMFLKRNPLSLQESRGCCLPSHQYSTKNYMVNKMQKYQQKNFKSSMSDNQSFKLRNSTSVSLKKTLKRPCEFVSARQVDNNRNSFGKIKQVNPFTTQQKEHFKERNVCQSFLYPHSARNNSNQLYEKNRCSNLSIKSMTSNYTNQQRVPLRRTRAISISQVIISENRKDADHKQSQKKWSMIGNSYLGQKEKVKSNKQLKITVIPFRQISQRRHRYTSQSQSSQELSYRRYPQNKVNYENKINNSQSYHYFPGQFNPIKPQFEQKRYQRHHFPSSNQLYQQALEVNCKRNPINIAAIKQKSLKLSASKKQAIRNQLLNLKQDQKLSLKSGECVRSRDNSITQFFQQENESKNPNVIIEQNNQNSLPKYQNTNVKCSAAVSTEVDMVNSDRNVFDSIIPLKNGKKNDSGLSSSNGSPLQTKKRNFLNRKVTVQSINDSSELASEQSIVVQLGDNKQTNKMDEFSAFNRITSIFS